MKNTILFMSIICESRLTMVSIYNDKLAKALAPGCTVKLPHIPITCPMALMMSATPWRWFFWRSGRTSKIAPLLYPQNYPERPRNEASYRGTASD